MFKTCPAIRVNLLGFVFFQIKSLPYAFMIQKIFILCSVLKIISHEWEGYSNYFRESYPTSRDLIEDLSHVQAIFSLEFYYINYIFSLHYKKKIYIYIYIFSHKL
jgi:hypothetical protein